MAEGDPDRQHEYTLEIINQIKDEVKIPKPLLKSIIAVIDADPIGKYLNSKHNLPIEESLNEIRKMTAALSVTIAVLWPTLMVYYQCDAAGYESLRRKVFITDQEGRAVYFNDVGGFRLKDPIEEERFVALRRRIESLAEV